MRKLIRLIPARALMRVLAAGLGFMTLVAVGGTAAAANGVFVPASEVASQTSASRSAAPDPTPPSGGAGPTNLPTRINDIDVDVDIDDHSDHSIHYAFSYTDNSTLIVEGDRYSSVYVYRDVDGRTYRGWNLSCLDFDTQTDAQSFFDHADADLYWLDGDGDGFACESGNGEFTRDTATSHGVRRGGQVDVLPSGSIDTGRTA